MSEGGIELHTAMYSQHGKTERRAWAHGTGIEDDEESEERDGAKLRERFWALSVVINLMSVTRSSPSFQLPFI